VSQERTLVSMTYKRKPIPTHQNSYNALIKDHEQGFWTKGLRLRYGLQLQRGRVTKSTTSSHQPCFL